MCYPMRRVAKRMDSTPFHGLEKVNHLPCHNVIFHLCTTRTLPPRKRFFSPSLPIFLLAHLMWRKISINIYFHTWLYHLYVFITARILVYKCINKHSTEFFSATKISRASFFERAKKYLSFIAR